MLVRIFETEDLIVDSVNLVNPTGKMWILYTPKTNECIDIEDDTFMKLIQVIRETKE